MKSPQPSLDAFVSSQQSIAVNSSALPFLRSPPFPGIAPAEVAISSLEAGGDDASVDDRLLDLIAQARVGGAFWGDHAQGFTLLVGQGVVPPADLIARIDPGEIGVFPVAGAGRRGHVAGRLLPASCDPWTAIEQAQAVCAKADDELAIVAGIAGKPVFGADGKPLSADELRASALAALARGRYRNCFTGAAMDVEEAIMLLSDWRRHIDGNKGIAAASGMAFWKRDVIGTFLWDGVRSPPFLPARRGLNLARRQGSALAIWPSRVAGEIVDEARAQSVPIIRVEDGFLRSRGLGAALHPPGSVVVDRKGIYYDALRPSDLEALLANHPLPAPLVARAARLRQRICATGVTKYGAQAGATLSLPVGRRTVLAVGQVDDDMSVRLGGAGIAGNLDFLDHVRRAEPDAWIVYRPHPDVQAGHRRGHLSDAVILQHADAIDTGASLMALVEAVDDVHVLSSLTGFEALMRDRHVTVHGMPFYAGWGLTRDLAPPNARRGRSLTIDQLVAAVLILYPRYLDPVTNVPCGPELMVDRLATNVALPVGWLIKLRSLQGKLRRFMTVFVESLRG